MAENRQSVPEEQQKEKRKELVLKLKNLKLKLEQTNIEEQVKHDLLKELEEVIKIATRFEEVVRLADVVYKISKSEETDIKFKGYLKSSLYKIYPICYLTFSHIAF